MAIILGGGLIVAGLAAWQVAASAKVINPFLTSSPWLIVKSLGHQLASGALPHSVAISALEFLVGFVISAVAGVSVGMLMGRYRYVEYAMDPYVWLLYSSPIVALFPLMVLIFGLGHTTVVAITVSISIVPIIVNSAQGVRNVDSNLIQTAKSFGASESAILRKVIFPASVPTVAAGLRLGMGRALVGVVIGEFFAGDGGIGFDVSYFAGQLQTTDVMAAVFVVVLAGVLLNLLARRLEKLADSWRSDLS